MKLTALGIESEEFDQRRINDLRHHLSVVRKWIHSSGEKGKSVCESARILNQLVMRDAPLVQYRGIRFKDPSVADSLLSGKVSTKYPCESWTPKEEVAESFVEDASGREILFLMKRKFSRNEIVLDVDGLGVSLKILAKELTRAEKQGYVHMSVIKNIGLDLLDLIKEAIAFAKFVKGMSEFEFLMHPRPYSPKDVLKVMMDRSYEKVDPSDVPRIAGLVSKSRSLSSFGSMTNKWLHVKDKSEEIEIVEKPRKEEKPVQLSALGIAAKDFTVTRANRLHKHLGIVSQYVFGDRVEKGKVCESAVILSKLLRQSPPLLLYRGLSFESISVADNLLNGQVSAKYPCESWTSEEKVGRGFASAGNQLSQIGFLMKREFSRNEVLLDNMSLVPVLKSLLEELEEALHKDQLHDKMDPSKLEEYQSGIEYFIGTVEDYQESEI